jgi:hypothetical protein
MSSFEPKVTPSGAFNVGQALSNPGTEVPVGGLRDVKWTPSTTKSPAERVQEQVSDISGGKKEIAGAQLGKFSLPTEYQALRSGRYYSILSGHRGIFEQFGQVAEAIRRQVEEAARRAQGEATTESNRPIDLSVVPEGTRAIPVVYPLQAETTRRRYVVEAACSTASASDSLQFEKYRVKTCSLLEFGGQARPAAIVQHYADLDVARVWFEYAYALATDDTLIAALDAVNPQTGRWDADSNGDPVGFLAQVRYVRAIAEAIANGYNALNIPWLNDPIGRGLWRDYFAGQDSGSDTSVITDYNSSHFYSKSRDADRLNINQVRVLLKARNSNAGAIPSALSSLIGRVVPQQDRHPIRFYFSAGVVLSSITESDGNPYYASRTINRGFATLSLSDNRFKTVGSSRHEVLEAADLTRDNVREDRFRVRLANVENKDEYNTDWYANRNDPDRIRRDWGIYSAAEYSDWRAFSYDSWVSGGDEEISATAPLRWYLQWLREWAKALTTSQPMVSDSPILGCPVPSQRSPQTAAGVPRRDVVRILVDSLSWSSDLNVRWVRALGERAFNEALTRTIEDQVNASVPEPNRTVTLIGETIGGVGGNIANTLLPGVGSIIGAGVSAITSLVARLIPESSRLAFGRDDLGRPKPSFERLSLDGSIRTGQKPTFNRVPPGYCRAQTISPSVILESVLCGQSAGATGLESLPSFDPRLPGGDGGLTPPPPPPRSSIGPMIALVLIVAIVAALAIRRKDPVRRSQLSARSGTL